jgi:2-methylcitrate dehydratase PrpD
VAWRARRFHNLNFAPGSAFAAACFIIAATIRSPVRGSARRQPGASRDATRRIPRRPEENALTDPKLQITSQAVEFVDRLRYEDLPEPVLKAGRRCVLDGVAVMVAGVAEETTRVLVEDAREQGGRKDALLLGAGKLKVPAPIAARVLGAAGHAHDWDDTQVSRDPRHQYGLLTHPTVPPLAAALAVSQYLRNVTGKQFMTAFLAGFEVECKLAEWCLPNLYKRSFHSSGVIGLFGAAAAAAKLLGVSGDRLRMAFGIAVSMAAGNRVNFGTMSKPLQVGRAAENGVTAALLARRGFTADRNAFDGPWGYCQVYADGVFEEKVAQGFGRTTWSIVDPGVSIKPYPSGILTHQAMDGMLKLVTEHDLSPGQIERIDFYAGSNILNPIRFPVAETHLQAKFSMAALLTMIVLNRQAGRREFTDEFIRSPAAQDMQRRIHAHHDPAIEALGTDIIRSRIEVSLKDGRRLVEHSPEAYRGGPDNPMSDADLEAKFRACAEGLLDEARRRQVIAKVRRIAAVKDVTALAKALQVAVFRS